METFKAWRELIRAVKDIAIAIGGGDNKSSGNNDNIKFWKKQTTDDNTSKIVCKYIIKVDSFLNNTDTEE